MKVLIALILGIIIGAGAIWFLSTGEGRSRMREAGDQIGAATKPALEAAQEKLKSLDLEPQHIKDELARSGQVVRRKAQQAGRAIADATADARITATIKGKLVADSDLSALGISVSTTDGVVTLAGAVPSADRIGRAMLLAMEVDGVREVISTLQVKPKAEKK